MANRGLAIVVIMILLAANHSTATYSTTKSNSTSRFQGNNGSMHEHYRLVEEDVADVELFLDSELAGIADPLNIRNALRSLAPVIGCGRGIPYKSCLPDPGNSKISENCRGGFYPGRNRGC